MVRTLSFCCLFFMAVAGTAPAQEPIPVSGSFDYTPQVNARVRGGGGVFVDASEAEIWTGDIEGMAIAPFRMVISPEGSFDAWLLAEFQGTVLGKYRGNMVIASRYERPAATANWTGDWIILSGTGELENVQGHGSAWGPGYNPKDPEAGPDIFYSGEIILPSD